MCINSLSREQEWQSLRCHEGTQPQKALAKEVVDQAVQVEVEQGVEEGLVEDLVEVKSS